ncbi:MAG: thioesterase family protein, partial [Rhodococcus ruber]|nr:thioesterase family protein [Rhodococcus ruber]
ARIDLSYKPELGGYDGGNGLVLSSAQLRAEAQAGTTIVQLTAYLRRLPAPGWLRIMPDSTVLGNAWFEEDHTVVDATGAVVVQSRQLAMVPR